MKTTRVAVGVILKDGQFFVCRRKSHQHQGDKWEFPGGKLEQGESLEDALTRELREEIGITVNNSKALTEIVFDYPEKRVELLVHLVNDFRGEAHGAEGQESMWVDFETLKTLNFPEANQAILKCLEAMYA